VLTQDVSVRIKEGAKNLNLYTYADDMALAADNISDTQKAMDVITQWADDNELKINLKMTELMVFRRAGRLPKEDYIVCEGHILTPKRQVTYLGITSSIRDDLLSAYQGETSGCDQKYK
jgi:Reverse transcriptase (RNA-dependent DNA polymerase).